MTKNNHFNGHVALLAAYIIFGLNTPVSKELLNEGTVSAMALTFFRFAGAAALFWVASLFVRREHVSLNDIGRLFIASLFGIFFNQTAFLAGLSMTSPIHASVIATLVPILTMILAAFFLREPVTWVKVTGVLIGAVGALLLISQRTTDLLHPSSALGDLLCIMSGTSFAIYLAAYKNLISRYSPVTTMKWMFLFSALCGLPFMLSDVTAIPYASLPVDSWLQIAYVVIAATFISYFLIPIGQKRLRPTVVSMYNYLQPVVSSLVAVALGMDAFGWGNGLASMLVFIGVYVVTRSKSRAQIEAEKN